MQWQGDRSVEAALESQNMGLRGAAPRIPGGQAGRSARRSAGWEQEVAAQDQTLPGKWNLFLFYFFSSHPGQNRKLKTRAGAGLVSGQ